MLNTSQVIVLLGTYNGERHLAEQLNSIIQQTHPHLKIIASDDGSTDRTLEILRQYPIEVHQGPRQGFAANFLHLIDKTDEASDYYAFADQDDVWDLDKLQCGLEFFAAIKPHEPALYCGRTLLVDEALTPVGYSSLFKKTPSFLNALVQSIGGGNTMIFNRAALHLLRQTKNKHHIVSHDWWTYLLVSGAGGHVFYDPVPRVRYRQHQNNLVGNNVSLGACYDRIRMLFHGRLKSWVDRNNQCLKEVAHLLMVEHRKQLEQFEQARHYSLVPRLINMIQLGIYRQTALGQLGLMVGILFNKV